MEFEESKKVQWASSSINDSTPSSDLVDGDDEVSSSSSSSTTCNNSSSASSNGPLYELADLMAQLPIKRGLSKFYNGKSQTFASLSKVESVEDLGKREMSCRRRMKSCKSYGGNLNIHHKFGPKPTIAKRSTKTSCSSSFVTKTSLFIINS